MTMLDDGLRRAGQIKDGTAQWPKITGQVKCAFRSAVDGTPQPYDLSIPASYDESKPMALYVYLHGRTQYDPEMGMGHAGETIGPGGGGGAEAEVRITSASTRTGGPTTHTAGRVKQIFTRRSLRFASDTTLIRIAFCWRGFRSAGLGRGRSGCIIRICSAAWKLTPG